LFQLRAVVIFEKAYCTAVVARLLNNDSGIPIAKVDHVE
jgi:hypothetical protein